MVAVGGLQGTGKSRLARALAPDLGVAPGALHLRSDDIRKRLAGVAPEQRLPEGAYTPARSRAVHAAMFDAARQALAAGRSVVVDAVFLDPAHRAGRRRAGGIPSPDLAAGADRGAAARVSARRGDASDATVEVLDRVRAGGPGGGLDLWLEQRRPAAPARKRAGLQRRFGHKLTPQGTGKEPKGEGAMAYRRLLLPLTGTSAGEAALNTALMVARIWEAHLHCLHVRVDARDVAPLAGEGLSGAMIEEMMAATERESGERAGRVRQLFERFTATHGDVTLASDPNTAAKTPGVTLSFEAIAGREEDVVAQQSRLYDMAVVPHPEADEDVSSSDALHAVLFDSGRPVLIAPRQTPSVIGTRVCIAWNGSAESAAAVGRGAALAAPRPVGSHLVLG
jgi:predicted kinase